MCIRKLYPIVCFILVTVLCLSCERDDPNVGTGEADVLSCYHQETAIYGQPFGVNLDPLRAQQLGENWSTIFTDIDYLRAQKPFYLRITLRAQWMQIGADWDQSGNLTVYYDTSPGSYYDQVKQIYDYSRSTAGSVKILAILFGTPEFNTEDGTNGSGVPINIEIWEDFVNKMLIDFPDIQAWEIWNEPDLYLSWKGTAQEFAERIYLPASNLIRNLKPDDIVIAPGWAQNYHITSFLPDEIYKYPRFGWTGVVDVYEPDKGDLTDFFVATNGFQAFDVWGVHGYANYALDESDWSAITQDFACQWDLWLQNLNGNSQTTEMWYTEIGIDNKPSGHTPDEAKDFLNYFIDDQFQDYSPLSDSELNGNDPYLTKIMVYELYDEYPYNNQGTFLGLFGAVGFPKPIAEVYREQILMYYN